MGKTKIKIVGDESQEEKKVEAKKEKHKKHVSLRKEKGVHISGLKGGERIVVVEGELPVKKEEKTKTTPYTDSEKITRIRKPQVKGKRYRLALTKIEPGKAYPIADAVKLAKETSIASFGGSLGLNLVFKKNGIDTSIDLPYSTGVEKRIEVANEKTIEKLKKGKLDFDVLLANPAIMPKLLPFAKTLGPKGLMPNPKQGTLTEDINKAKEKFNSKTVWIKTVKDSNSAPVAVGKVNQEDKEITQNIATIINTLGANIIKKAVLSPTMGPGVKIAVS